MDFDFLDTALTEVILLEDYIKNIRDDRKLFRYLGCDMKRVFTDNLWSWPCPNLHEFGFVLNLTIINFNYVIQKRWRYNGC